jgi:methionyl-tRNA formyltransferase
VRIIFFGTPLFAVPSLDALIQGPDELAAVVSQPDRPTGRGLRAEPPPVARHARDAGVPVLQPEKLNADAVERIRELAPDLIVTAAYGRILRPAVLSIPKHGCLNVHASLLPRQRGAAPIPRAILDGDALTGVTIFRLDEGMDTGPILLQRITPILTDDTTGALTDRLARIGALALTDACDRIRSGTARFVPQREDLATYAPMLAKEDGICDFARPADQIDRFVRAYHPWPGAAVRFRGESLKIARVEPVDLFPAGDRPGVIVACDPSPIVAALPGTVRLLRVQPAGKREMDADAWARGARIAPGERIG